MANIKSTSCFVYRDVVLSREVVGCGVGTPVGAVCAAREFGYSVSATAFADYDPYEGCWVEDNWD